MTTSSRNDASPQGFHATPHERLPLPARESMNEAQRAAADAIVNGPRKAIFGPFVPLLRTPTLMEHIGKTGETLRFNGTLADAIRELVICVVARETHNQFEWQTHAPLAVKAGIPEAAIAALAAGRRPHGLNAGAAVAAEFAFELMARQGVSDAAYAEAVACFGEAGTVELTALIGYFTMVCWVMNVARTPGPAGTQAPALSGLPL